MKNRYFNSQTFSSLFFLGEELLGLFQSMQNATSFGLRKKYCSKCFKTLVHFISQKIVGKPQLLYVPQEEWMIPGGGLTQF